MILLRVTPPVYTRCSKAPTGLTTLGLYGYILRHYENPGDHNRHYLDGIWLFLHLPVGIDLPVDTGTRYSTNAVNTFLRSWRRRLGYSSTPYIALTHC